MEDTVKISKTNDRLLANRRRRTRTLVINENREIASIKAAQEAIEQQRLKEQHREWVQRTLEENKRRIEEKKKNDEMERIRRIEEARIREVERLKRIEEEKARVKARETLERKLALNAARKELKEKIQKEKEKELLQMQKFLESKKNQEEKQKKIRIEQQRAKEDEVKSKIRAIEEEKKLQEREKRLQIRNERRNAIKRRFLKKMNEYNIDWTNDRRAIKWKVLDQKDNLFKKRESIQRRKEELVRMKIELEEKRKQEEEEIRKRAEQESKELEEYLAAAQQEFQTNLNNYLLQEEINDAIERERLRKIADQERIALENLKKEKYKTLQEALDATQKKAVDEYVQKIEAKRKLRELEAKKTQEEKIREKEEWRAMMKETIEKLKKEYDENPQRRTASLPKHQKSAEQIQFSALETEQYLIEAFNEFFVSNKNSAIDSA